MAPMMEPRPRLFNKEKAQARAEAEALQAAAAKRRATMVRMVLACALGGAGMALILWFMLSSTPAPGPAPQASPPNLAKALESNADWFEAARDGGSGERLQTILKENPGLKPGQRMVKTGRIVMNLRTLEGKWGPVPAEAPKAPAPPPREAGGASGGSPMQEAPPPPTEMVTE